MIYILKFWRECLIALLAFAFLILLIIQNHTAGELKKAESSCTAKIQALEDIKDKQAKKASDDYEQTKADQTVKTEVVYKTVQKIVDRPVYVNNCSDDDGRLQINELIKIGNTK